MERHPIFAKSADPEFLNKLGKHFLDKDKRERCDFSCQPAQAIKRDVRKIIDTIRKKLSSSNGKFSCKLITLGSAHEELKVGSADEFDFMFEMTIFDQEDMKYIPSDVGFADVKILIYHDQLWPVIDHSTPVGRRRVLDPKSLQEEFRRELDDIVKSMDLPATMRHGGRNSPEFPGFRRHGPATLYQFIWRSSENEVRINVDITLAIKVPRSVELSVFQLNGLDRFKLANSWTAELLALLERDPGLHVVPLYSREMILKGRFEKKYSWRSSCSLAEKRLLEKFTSGSLLKTVIRLTKILRDQYLIKDRSEEMTEEGESQEDIQNRVDDPVRKMQSIRAQETDISFSQCQRNENWGPFQYLTSYEIKTKFFELLLSDKFPYGEDEAEKHPEDVARYVIDFFLCFYEHFSGSEQKESFVRSLYMDKAVWAPLGAEDSKAVVSKLDCLFDDLISLHDQMEKC